MIRAFLVFSILAPAQAGAFSLPFPVDCKLNETCFINARSAFRQLQLDPPVLRPRHL